MSEPTEPTEPGTEPGNEPAGEHTRTGADYSPQAEAEGTDAPATPATPAAPATGGEPEGHPDEGPEVPAGEPGGDEAETTGQTIAGPADTDSGAPGAQSDQPREVEGDTTGQTLAPPAVTDRGA